MKGFSWHIITLAAVVLAMGCTNDKQDAEQLFMEAEGLVQSAQGATKQSFSEGLKLYEDAAKKAMTITEKYPDLENAGSTVSGMFQARDTRSDRTTVRSGCRVVWVQLR